MRKPGLVVKWAGNRKVPSKVSSAAIPPMSRCTAYRRRHVLAFGDSDEHPCQHVTDLINDCLSDVEARIAESKALAVSGCHRPTARMTADAGELRRTTPRGFEHSRGGRHADSKVARSAAEALIVGHEHPKIGSDGQGCPEMNRIQRSHLARLLLRGPVEQRLVEADESHRAQEAAGSPDL